MDNTIFDRLIYLASQYTGQPELELYNNATASFEPSPKYKRRMNHFLKRVERQEMWDEWKSVTVPLKRVAAVIMIVCTVSLGCILSISAVREAIWSTIVEWYDKYIEVLFVADDAVEVPTEILVYKEPSVGLEGYERFEIVKNTHLYCVEYELVDASGYKLVKYEQSMLGVFPVLFTNAGSILNDITVFGNPGVYIKYTLQGVDYIGLTWNDGEYQYTLEGNVRLDELVAIAESIK